MSKARERERSFMWSSVVMDFFFFLILLLQF